MDLTKRLSPDTLPPARRGMPWWEGTLIAMLMIGLLYTALHQFQRLVAMQQTQEAARACGWAAEKAARDTYQAGMPDWRFYGGTLAVERRTLNDGTWWYDATPTFRCNVMVDAERAVGVRRASDPMPSYFYTVAMTGFPGTSTPNHPLPSTVTPLKDGDVFPTLAGDR